MVEACDDDKAIEADGFTFTALEGIEVMVQNQTIDVIGVVLELGVTSSINLKDGSSRNKKTLTIGDEGNMSIAVTLWGELCEAHIYEIGQIIAFRGCRISDYNGKSLNASSQPSDLVFNPRHARAHTLAKWHKGFATGRAKPEMKALTVDN